MRIPAPTSLTAATVQGDFPFDHRVVYNWYLLNSDLSIVHYLRVHWTSHFIQGTRNTRPCLTGHPVGEPILGKWQQLLITTLLGPQPYITRTNELDYYYVLIISAKHRKKGSNSQYISQLAYCIFSSLLLTGLKHFISICIIIKKNNISSTLWFMGDFII